MINYFKYKHFGGLKLIGGLSLPKPLLKLRLCCTGRIKLCFSIRKSYKLYYLSLKVRQINKKGDDLNIKCKFPNFIKSRRI